MGSNTKIQSFCIKLANLQYLQIISRVVYLNRIQMSSVQEHTVRNRCHLLKYFVLQAWAEITAVLGISCHCEAFRYRRLCLRLLIIRLLVRR